MRQVVLDTETTGLDPVQGHRVIEIGAVELDNRRPTGRHFHRYLNPDREIDEGAQDVHGITLEFLADKPRFEQVAAEFLAFVEGAELVIHNAPFDLGFLNAELERLTQPATPLEQCCSIVDTLALARKKHPGQRNNLDALCKRYAVDNTQRTFHGALLDAQILADVYLAMTGGQTRLLLGIEEGTANQVEESPRRLASDRPPLRVIRAAPGEKDAHQERLRQIDAESRGGCVWLRLEPV